MPTPEAIHSLSACTWERLLSGAAGLSMNPPVVCSDSDSSAGSSIDRVDVVPITGDDNLVVLHGCSDPTGVSPEKLLAAGHFSELDLGQVMLRSAVEGKVLRNAF